jgi:hypothetical protein
MQPRVGGWKRAKAEPAVGRRLTASERAIAPDEGLRSDVERRDAEPTVLLAAPF